MPKTTRITRKVVAGITDEQFSNALSSYAINDAQSRKMAAKMDADITRIREKYADGLDELKKANDAHLQTVQVYCSEHKQVLFGERRSLDTVYGKVGFRLGTPKLKTLPRWTWDKVLDKLHTVLPDYVRIKKEIDKEQLLANRAQANVAEYLNAIGVYVAQEEAFFIELKKEEA